MERKIADYLTMDEQVVEKWFDRYPKLETICCVGTVSLKMAREVLRIDRYEMYDIFIELVEANAVYQSGSSCFRATPALREYVLQRLEKEAQQSE